ncbi:unnamed protein product [Scytosiphon promiscuus]
MESFDIEQFLPRREEHQDVWGSVVASGDAAKLSEMVVEGCGSKTEVALSLLRNCVGLLEKDLAQPTRSLDPSFSPTTSGGSAQSPCLDAFAVALGQACDGEEWYTSTKELQLASLPFCEACRSVTTLELIVDDETPRGLTAAADAPPSSRQRLCASRVPRLRARRVWWNLRTAIKLNKPIDAVADATEIFFDKHFVGSLGGVVWPQQLKKVQFPKDSNFNRPIDHVAWPASVQQLTFGECFNQPIGGVVWPESLHDLTFGQNFDRSVQETRWPPNLRRITFGSYFDKPIEAASWPDSVRELEFGEGFDRPIVRVAWPSSLQKVTFGNFFNQPIEGVAWPNSIRQLSFGQRFNQPIDRVAWPAPLADLSFGYVHNDLHGGMVLLSAFNRPIDRATWPASLRRITLGSNFRQSLAGLGVWMPNLEELCLMPENRSSYKSLLAGIQWPYRLRLLTVYWDSGIESLGLPESVRVSYREQSRVELAPPRFSCPQTAL